MNELQVKTINIQPAVIEFNHEEIEKELEANLKKYEGLVFSEENATDLRKTIAELRKGKNAVDRYRIDTKKKLNEPVKAFEDKCKQLDKRFENVITPLVEQQNEFEEKRRAEKLEKLEKIRLEHIESYGLNEEYHDRVAIDDSMLTKSTSLRVAGESLEFQVKNLKMEQDKKAADAEIIITTVKLINSENDLSLSADAYVRLLEFNSLDDVKEQVMADVEKENLKRVAAEKAEQERIEREKRVELERIAREEQETLKEDEKHPEKPVIEEYEQVPLSSAPASKSVDEIPFADDPFLSDPFSSSSDPFADPEEEKITITYQVTGTNDELLELLSYLLKKELTYEVIE